MPLLPIRVSVTMSWEPGADGVNLIPSPGAVFQFWMTQFSTNSAAPLTNSMPMEPPNKPMIDRLRILTTMPAPLPTNKKADPARPAQSIVIDLLMTAPPNTLEEGPESRQLISPP